jgi:hypothetical protein
MESPILPSQFQLCPRCLLSFLDEAMQQNHPALRVNIKQHPSDLVSTQTRPDFVKTVAQGFTNRHANRPTKFHGFDVYADLLPIRDRAERPQPLTHRLPASASTKEDYLDALLTRGLDLTARVPRLRVYHIRYTRDEAARTLVTEFCNLVQALSSICLDAVIEIRGVNPVVAVGSLAGEHFNGGLPQTSSCSSAH